MSVPSANLGEKVSLTHATLDPPSCMHRRTVANDSTGPGAHCQILELQGFASRLGSSHVTEDICRLCLASGTPHPERWPPRLASLIFERASHALRESGQHEAQLHWSTIKQRAYDQLPFVLTKAQAQAERPPNEPRLCRRCSVKDQRTAGRSCIRFIRSTKKAVGQGVHRSGWPYAMRSLEELRCRHGILFDDFVEQRFSYQAASLPTTEPWVGIFHHPPKVPDFVIRCHHLEAVFERKDWRASAPHLRGAIALSEYLAKFLREQLDIPVATIKHPAEIPDRLWSSAEYLRRPRRQVLQLGWHLRNTRAIYQLPPLPTITRLRMLPGHSWIRAYDQNVKDYWCRRGGRREFAGVEELGFVSPEEYDGLLSTSVVLTELLDASANNVVVDCIARNTPMIINRHPAVVEYLGTDYPLYFDEWKEANSLLTDDRILAAHEHLARMDKCWLDGEHFQRAVALAVRGFSSI